MRVKLAFLLLFVFNASLWAQTTIFSENMGSSSGTVSITAHSFQNSSLLIYSNGGQTSSADVRTTSASSGYIGSSAGSNIYFTSTAGAYGFSIEGINASNYTTLSLQYAYKKESASALASFSVDYWNGSSWISLANSPSTLFNETATANAVWYLGKTLALPTDAQINGLKIRFVKSGTVSIRIDDVKLTGTEVLPTLANTSVTNVTSNSADFAGNVITTGGYNIVATGTVYSETTINSNPILGGAGVVTLSTSAPNSGAGSFSNVTGAVLLPNVQYSYNAYASNTNSTSGYGIVSTFYTLAVSPSSPTVTNPTGSSLDVTLGSDINSTQTTYAIYETTTSKYVQANGTLGTAALYQTAAIWGTKRVSGLSPSTNYTFQITAKNGNGVVTTPSLSANGTTLVSPSIITSGILTALSTAYGTASSFTSFSVSGNNLTDTILITAPAGFEISKISGGVSGYASTQVLTPVSGAISTTTIYVRLAATTSFGTYAGNIVLSSTNDGLTVNIATISSSVIKKDITLTGITALNKEYDGNTVANLTGTAILNGVLVNDNSNVILNGNAVTANFNDATIGIGKSITVNGYSLNGSAALNYNLIQPIGLIANITANATSDIIFNTSSPTSDNTNINYKAYQVYNITSTTNSAGVMGFYLRDGGAGHNDADNLPTELTSISFNVTKSANIRSARLFVNNSPRGVTVPMVNGVLTFTGLTDIIASDNTQLAINLRVTFNSTVMDNDQMQFSIASATANLVGSQFALSNAGGAFSSITGDINKIEVTADRLAFVQQPTSYLIDGDNMNPAPTVQAIDANGNRDLDFAGNVELTSSGSLTVSPQNATASQGLAIFTTINHTAPGEQLFLTAAYTGLTSVVSDEYSIKIRPLFTQVEPICFGNELGPLPTTSTNGVTGVWSPEIDNTASKLYHFTPTEGQSAIPITMVIIVNPEIVPEFNELEPICIGSPIAAFPTTSINNILGTWDPVLDNTATANYTFTPQVGQCATKKVITVTVNPLTVPSFEEVEPICIGSELVDLPTLSLEGITGAWSPALNNQESTTYTFTPDPGQCASTSELTITVIPTTIPTFDPIEPQCAGLENTVLLTTSLEGITGIWTPAFNNNATQTYTFNPGAGICAVKTSVAVIIYPSIVPSFDAVDPICSGDTLNELPTTSNNGITGTWSPDIDNTVTTSYTFTPDAGQDCAIITNLTIVVNPGIPTFNPVVPICAGETLNELPTTSTNGYTGTWYPELNNSYTTIYTFTPTSGQCASNSTLTITVKEMAPVFSNITVCVDTPVSSLPTTSTNDITGTWSINTSGLMPVYIFTPNPGQCATGNTLSIEASPIIVPTFDPVYPVPTGMMMADLPLTSLNGIDGTWSPELNNTVTTTYTFTPDYGQCASSASLTIEITNDDSAELNSLANFGVGLGASNEVGVTPGELSVSSSGGAVYNIPIAVPPGINGVVPQVGLNYNSQSGFGTGGYGWNITGLSAITRVPSTKFHDNLIDPVDFDSNDRYSLDGQRLMLKSGTYGAVNSVYETENFSNTKITFLGSFFRVEYPDGTQAVYGFTPDSKVGTLTYAVKQWTNPQGVTIVYNYTQTNNNLYINSIKYGSTSGSSTQINDVQFVYKNRNRSEQYYVAGLSIKDEKVLSQIKVIGNGVGYRNYILNHDVVFGYERLKSITEKNGDGSKSYSPTVFNYGQDNTNGFTSFEKIPFVENQPSCNSNLPESALYYTGDFDGDGDTDFIYGNTLFTKVYDNASIPVSQCVVDTANPHLYVGSYSTDPVKCLEQNGTGYNLMNRDALCKVQRSYQGENYTTINVNVYAKSAVGSAMVEEYSKKVLMNEQVFSVKPGDFNGDSLSDYLFIANSDIQNPHFYFFDLDRRVAESNSVNDLGILALGSSNYKIATGDFNGDGKTDITILSANNTVRVYTMEGNSLVLLWQTPFTFIHPNSNNLFTEEVYSNYHHVPNWVYFCCQRTGDCITQPQGTSVSYSCLNTDQYHRPQYDRSGWWDLNADNPPVHDTKVYNYPFIVGDFNSDGKSDILMPGLERSLLMSTGISFESEGLSSVYPSAHDLGISTIQTDYNNDGKCDLLNVKKVSENKYAINNYQRISKGNWIRNSSITYTKNLGTANRMTPQPIMVLPSKSNYDKPQLLVFESYRRVNPDNSHTVLPNKVFFYTNEDSFTKTKLINDITLGNGVKQSILYRPLTATSDVYTFGGQIVNYPNYEITNSSGIKLVSQIDLQSKTVYKRQLYKYHGYIGNVEGLGFLGFRATTGTNWFESFTNAISTVTKSNIAYRGAPDESFSVLGIAAPTTVLQPTDSYISKTVYSYNNYNADNPLLANKVFKVRNTFSQNFNGLHNIITNVSSQYDVFNLKKRTTLTYSNNGNSENKSFVEEFVYDDLPNTMPYFIGRPKSKKTSSTLAPSGDESVIEEEYIYNSNLLSQTKKRSKNSNELSHYIVEINTYDIYGNIKTKTLKTPDATPVVQRTSTYEYDSQTHRFITKKIDIQGLETNYTYDMSRGQLLSETLPSSSNFPIKTVCIYDSWGKKIKTIKYLATNSTYVYTDTYSNITEGVLHTISSNDGKNFKIIVDDMGREIHSQTKDINDKWSCVSTIYDVNDRPIKVSEPYFITGSSLGNFTLWNETQYDVYGRVIKSNYLKSNTSPGKQTTIGYDGLITTESFGSQQKIIVNDIFGNVKSLSETGASTIDYTYYANGNLSEMNSDGVSTSFLQDGWGRRKSLIDPSAGTYNYTYNDFNELLSEEVVGKGITKYTISPLGIINSKIVTGYSSDTPNTNTAYVYDNATKLLKSVVFSDPTNSNTVNYTFDYDNFRRIWRTTEKRNSFFEFQKEYRFDSFGRVEKEHFIAKDLSTSANKVSDKWIKTNFKNGEKWQMYDMTSSTNVGSTKLWQTNTVDANGNILTASLGNGINIEKSYDTYGFPKQIKHSKGSVNIMILNTEFNPINGNLTRRNYSLFNWDERPTYDDLDRLTSYKDPMSSIPFTQSYNSNGTIASNNIGTHAYTDTPFKISSITPSDWASPTSPVINYYINRKQEIGFNVFKSPTWITEQGKENIDFEYNGINGRSVMYYGNEQPTKAARTYRKFYSADGSMEIKRKISGNIDEFVTYIGGDAYTAPVVLKSNGTIQSYYYLHRDYQGSILAITNGAGNVVEKRLFDVWGSLIKYDSYGVTNPPVTSTGLFLDRGFTGHEHLLGVGLINMNGRVYDPKLHRFLQPDNYIQDPSNTQNYNRYGYCMNNPTKYTDPGGEEYGGPGPDSPGWTQLGGSLLSSFLSSGAFGSSYNSANNIGNFYNPGNTYGGHTNPSPAAPNYSVTNYGGSTYQDSYNYNNGSGNGNNTLDILDIANFFGKLKQSYNDGLNQKIKEWSDAVKAQWNDFSGYWANTLSDFGTDFWNGRTMIAPSDEYKEEIFTNFGRMTVYDWAYAAGYSTPDAVVGCVAPYAFEGIATGIGRSFVLMSDVSALGWRTEFGVFGMRNGYGVFGENGFVMKSYRLDVMYANPSAGQGAGTIFSLRQTSPGGAMWRWDYGTLHSTGEMGFHSTIRFHFNGKKFGSAAQRSWYPRSFQAPFFTPIKK